MNITSQFFLLHYIGHDPLDLMHVPASFANDIQLSSDYYSFINGISTIYGSQNSEGSVPVFWTELSGYNRLPSPDSTLRALMPDQNYYVISLNNNVLPLTVPPVNGYLQGTADPNATRPSPTIVFPNYDKLSADIILDGKNNNYAYFSTTVSGLIPRETYKYTFSGIDSNWPAIISPISGLIKPSKTSVDIESVLTFCSTSGGCDTYNGILPYSLDTSANYQKNNYFSILSLNIEPVSYTGTDPVSEQLTIRCRDCLPQPPSLPVISMPLSSASSGNGSDITLTGINNNYCYLSPRISGLIPGESYTYTVDSLAGNWPIVIYPSSGIIKPTKDFSDIEVVAAFCASTGTCPPGTPGLSSSYVLASDFSRAYAHNNYFALLNVTVQQNNYPFSKITSDQISVRCSNCLPSNAVLLSYPNITFMSGAASTSNMVFGVSCCSGSKPMVVNVTNAVPGDRYVYNFESPTNKITFSPSSGVTYFGSNGAGNINTIMNTSLADGDQFVINCSLNNTIYDIPTIDFLTIKCGSGCNI